VLVDLFEVERVVEFVVPELKKPRPSASFASSSSCSAMISPRALRRRSISLLSPRKPTCYGQPDHSH
jgi:hypothetical protein